jgi:hypothetical protein
MQEETQPDAILGKLYPHLTTEQLKGVEENLDRYLELALRLFERIRHNPEAYAQFAALTASTPGSTMSPQRSKAS